MEEYINEIREYLPISYQDKDNNDYIDYLINAFLKTSEIGNYQFSFLAFHLLYMSFIYKVIRQSYDQDMRNIRNLIRQFEKDISGYDNPFDLSVIAENKSINMLKCIGFHKNKLAEFQSIILHRNNVAHASGFVQYDENQIRRFIEDELKNIEEIQAKSAEVLSGLFETYFEKNFDLDDNSNFFPSGFISVEKFVEANILSINDLELLATQNLSFLDEDSGDLTIVYKKVFYLLVAGKVDVMKGYETDYFLNLLPTLLRGFEKQDAIEIGDLFNNEFQDVLFDIPQENFDRLEEKCNELGVNYEFNYFNRFTIGRRGL